MKEETTQENARDDDSNPVGVPSFMPLGSKCWEEIRRILWTFVWFSIKKSWCNPLLRVCTSHCPLDGNSFELRRAAPANVFCSQAGKD